MVQLTLRQSQLVPVLKATQPRVHQRQLQVRVCIQFGPRQAAPLEHLVPVASLSSQRINAIRYFLLRIQQPVLQRSWTTQSSFPTCKLPSETLRHLTVSISSVPQITPVQSTCQQGSKLFWPTISSLRLLALAPGADGGSKSVTSLTVRSPSSATLHRRSPSALAADRTRLFLGSSFYVTSGTVPSASSSRSLSKLNKATR